MVNILKIQRENFSGCMCGKSKTNTLIMTRKSTGQMTALHKTSKLSTFLQCYSGQRNHVM